MKKTILMAAVALAMIATAPAMAQQKGGKGMRDPKARTEKMAEKLNFTADQRAQLDALNKKYPGTDFDRKKYREEFRAIMTDAQKKQVDDMKAAYKEKRAKKD